MPHGHRDRGRPKNTVWKRDLEKMWTAGYKYSWGKMEAAAQNRDEDGEKRSVAYVRRVERMLTCSVGRVRVRVFHGFDPWF